MTKNQTPSCEQLSPLEARTVAAMAMCSPRVVVSYVLGKSVRWLTAFRIGPALQNIGRPELVRSNRDIILSGNGRPPATIKDLCKFVQKIETKTQKPSVEKQ